MKRAKRNYIIYTVMLIVFALAMVWVAQVGKNYDGMAPQPGAGVTQSMGEMIYGTLTGNLNHPLSLLLLQIIVVHPTKTTKKSLQQTRQRYTAGVPSSAKYCPILLNPLRGVRYK